MSVEVALIVGLIALAQPSVASDPPTVQLPATADRGDWAPVAKLVGVALVDGGQANITMASTTSGWRMEVIDDEGGRHILDVGTPVSATHREELLWLARSLVAPVDAPLLQQVPLVASAPREPKSEGTATLPRDEGVGPVLAAGLMFGVPSGATMRAGLTGAGTHSLELRVGSPERRWLWLQASYLASVPVGTVGAATLRGYVGGGVVVEGVAPDGPFQGWKGPWIGPRAPAGLLLTVGPVEVFADVSPTWLIGKRQGLMAPIAAGVRLSLRDSVIRRRSEDL